MIESSSPGPLLNPRARRLQLVLCLLAAAATLLPAPWSALLLAACAGGLLAGRPPLRERLAIAFGLALACATVGGAWILDLRAARGGRDLEQRARREYEEWWNELEERAATAARAISTPPSDSGERLKAFGTLRGLLQGATGRRRALLLVDGDGEVVAWAGEGLPLEPRGESLPAAGAWNGQSDGAATLAALSPLPHGGGWRVVAGESLSTRRAPFAVPGIDPTSIQWSLGTSSEAGALTISAPRAPPLTWRVTGEAAKVFGAQAARWAHGWVGLTLLALATMRAVGLLLLAGTVVKDRRRGLEVSLLLAAGAGLWSLAAGSSAVPAASLAGAILAAAAALGLPRGGLPTGFAFLFGGIAAAALAAAAWGLRSLQVGVDLAASFGGGGEAVSWRLTLAAASLALLVAAASRSRRTESSDAFAWIAVTLLVAGAATHDRPAVGWALLAAGCACAGRWLVGAEPLRRASSAGVALLLACMASALAWETAHRGALRDEAVRLLPRLQPPGNAELRALDSAVREHFSRLESRRPSGTDHRDLAYTLWRASPLARPNLLSALAATVEGETISSFSFGLPLDDGELDRDPGRWEVLSLPAWDDTLISGELEPRERGGLTVRYWALPRPGFLLDAGPAEDLELALLRADPAQQRRPAGLSEPLLAALYAPDGRALRSPWRESPPLPPALRQRVDPTIVTIPQGLAWAVARRGSDGVEALFLEILSPRAALDRVGTHALSSLLLFAGAALLAVLLGLPREAFRDALRRAVRSYSKRLILVITLLLLVPLLLLNAVLLRGLDERLQRQQRAAGEAAITAAQQRARRIRLDPGARLRPRAPRSTTRCWCGLARCVHHEVNLYWGSRIYASSRRELFTAGAAAEPHPGRDLRATVAARLRHSPTRTSRAGDTTYLELYAPLRVPGAPDGEGAARSSRCRCWRSRKRRARSWAACAGRRCWCTAALFLLLVAVGTRLARNFTRPLTELVDGTRRIAAGAASLEARSRARWSCGARRRHRPRWRGRIAEGASGWCARSR